MYILDSGTYLLIVELAQPIDVIVTSGKTFVLEPGYYGYIGSALNGLQKRIDRHLSRNKKLHWHIDYLLQIATIESVIYVASNKRIECLIAQELIKKHQYVSGFGCSDCRCKSHLFYSDDIKAMKNNAMDAFKLCNLEPVVKTMGSNTPA
jgi:sugar fermentation stimulation protein A